MFCGMIDNVFVCKLVKTGDGAAGFTNFVCYAIGMMIYGGTQDEKRGLLELGSIFYGNCTFIGGAK